MMVDGEHIVLCFVSTYGDVIFLEKGWETSFLVVYYYYLFLLIERHIESRREAEIVLDGCRRMK